MIVKQNEQLLLQKIQQKSVLTLVT